MELDGREWYTRLETMKVKPFLTKKTLHSSSMEGATGRRNLMDSKID